MLADLTPVKLSSLAVNLWKLAAKAGASSTKKVRIPALFLPPARSGVPQPFPVYGFWGLTRLSCEQDVSEPDDTGPSTAVVTRH